MRITASFTSHLMLQLKSISEYRSTLEAAEAKIAGLEAENGQLKERVRKLESQLETAQRAAKRQAAPFSRGKRPPSGQRPGRRSGEQYQEELPEIRALVSRVSGKWARCTRCGRRVRGRHPRQTSEATGAAAAQVGPRALAFACSLHKEHGLSVRKTTATLVSWASG